MTQPFSPHVRLLLQQGIRAPCPLGHGVRDLESRQRGPPAPTPRWGRCGLRILGDPKGQLAWEGRDGRDFQRQPQATVNEAGVARQGQGLRWEGGCGLWEKSRRRRGAGQHPGSQAAPLLFLALLPGSQLPTLSSGLGRAGRREEVWIHGLRTCPDRVLSPARGPQLCWPLPGAAQSTEGSCPCSSTPGGASLSPACVPAPRLVLPADLAEARPLSPLTPQPRFPSSLWRRAPMSSSPTLRSCFLENLQRWRGEPVWPAPLMARASICPDPGPLPLLWDCLPAPPSPRTALLNGEVGQHCDPQFNSSWLL